VAKNRCLASRTHTLHIETSVLGLTEIMRVITTPSSMVSGRVRRLYSFSFETGENESDSHFASKRKNLSEFFKLNLFIFVRVGGKCERFAFRFEPKIIVSETGAPYCQP
jgi:hypothetical protein